jgi:molybdopterin molybdotransferase
VTPPLSVESALARILAPVRPLPAELVALLVPEIDGRATAETLHARVPLPGFDNSAMDGYAVRAAEAATSGARLEIRGETAAGTVPLESLNPGTALRIFTGAPIPTGADAVIMQEDVTVDRDGRFLTIVDPVKPWENIRFRGEDATPGDPLISAGTVLGPHHVAALLASGWDQVPVHRRPRVALVTSGSELRPPGSPLSPGQIHESNSGMLAALVRRAGGVVVSTDCVPDAPDLLRAALESAADRADVILTAGGASVGDHDLVRPCLVAAGGVVDFWRIDMKPGKPFLHGRLKGTPLFGLPGNPVSAFVTAVLFVLPVLRRLQGSQKDPHPATVATWATDVENGDRRRHYVRVAVDAEGRIRPSGPQASHRLASLASAEGLVAIPGHTRIAAGSPARIITW